MDNFWVVTLFHLQPSAKDRAQIEFNAVHDFESMGIEEFALNEAEVDAILGERSYSGGDLPQEVLDEVEQKVLSRPTNYRFFFKDAKDAIGFLQTMKNDFLCEAQLEECEGQDWNAEWKKHYAPILVNDELEIIPSWMKGTPSRARNQIHIYPGMGFGTGSHETTFLCLKLFTENILGKPMKTILDFGSGSGILGLSTLKFHPDLLVDFYDIDPEANKNCFQNAELNDLTACSFRLLLPEVRERLLPEYDVVFANILESILLMEKSSLISHTAKDGHLILSGLLRHQAEGIEKAYQAAGMKLIRKMEKGDWVALLFQKAQ